MSATAGFIKVLMYLFPLVKEVLTGGPRAEYRLKRNRWVIVMGLFNVGSATFLFLMFEATMRMGDELNTLRAEVTVLRSAPPTEVVPQEIRIQIARMETQLQLQATELAKLKEENIELKSKVAMYEIMSKAGNGNNQPNRRSDVLNQLNRE